MIQSGWDTFLVAIPLLGLFLASNLHLDEIAAAPKRRKAFRRSTCGFDEEGRLLLTDPDGRPMRNDPVSK
jgi:hypothetical protein